MTPELNGVMARGPAATWAASSAIPLDLRFLDEFERMDAAEIDEIGIHGNFSVSSSGTTDGEDMAKALSNVTLRDSGGELVNCSGQGLRVRAMAELGDTHFDPADYTSAAADTSYDVWWRIPLAAPKSVRSADSARELLGLQTRSGASFIATTGTATAAANGTIASGSLTPYAIVREARSREAKARLCVREIVVSALEDRYSINGSLRRALLHTIIATTGATDLSAYTSFDSQSLLFPPALNEQALLWQYRSKRPHRHANDEIVAQTAIALFEPYVDQRIGRLPNLLDLHLRIPTLPGSSSGRLLVEYYSDRHAATTAKWLGVPVETLTQAILQRGEVVSEGPANRDPRNWDLRLLNRLPLRLRAA